MLKRLYVQNYRTLVNFEWKPPPVCVLVGENGSGKSSIIEVLCLLQDVVVDGISIGSAFAGTRTEWLKELKDPVLAQVFELDLEHKGESFRYRLMYREDHRFGYIRENLSVDGVEVYQSEGGQVQLLGAKPEASATIAFDRRRSFISAMEPSPDNRRIVAFREAMASIRTAKPDPQHIEGSASEESIHLARDFANFANWYRAKVGEDPDAAVALRKDLQRALPGFDQLRLEPITASVKDLRVRFSFGKKSHELSWDKLSDGQRMLIALYGFFRFAFPHASVFALDEIENYVSPHEIQPWLRAVLDAAAESNRQVLLISHHPESINYLAADAVWRMWRDPAGGHSRIELMEPDRDAGETAYDLLKMGPSDAD